MPSASDRDRDEMIEAFGDLDCCAPEEYLRRRGWICDRGFWIYPYRSYIATEFEWACFSFLIWEWDYGGIVGYGKEPWERGYIAGLAGEDQCCMNPFSSQTIAARDWDLWWWRGVLIRLEHKPREISVYAL